MALALPSRAARSATFAALLLSSAVVSTAALAAPGDPVAVGDGFTIDPQVDARLRIEHVDMDSLTIADADAFTARFRTGVDIAHRSGFSFFAEIEATVAIDGDYNSTVNGKTGFATIADPQSFEFNRVQLRYATGHTTLTAGRQRIAIDDQRFVGPVGWRDNEQTFDAVRLESSDLGPVAIDLAYAASVRTIFGSRAHARTAFDGNFLFGNASGHVGPVTLRLFDYYLDYDANEPVAARMSSNTIGIKASGRATLAPQVTLDLAASYARQRDIGVNPTNYSADYIWASGALAMRGFTLTAAFEQLGSSNGVASFQTPLATLHKFNGWADLFLTAPANGLTDYQLTLSRAFPHAIAQGLTLTAAYHRYESDRLGLHYGNEWDAQAIVRLSPRTSVTAKYAHYDADVFSTDTDKLWLQLDYSY